jgi:hypothetical protein
MNTEEVKEQIRREMEELGYNVIPDLDNMELVDVTLLNYEGRMSYYQNLSKRALELEFINHIRTTIPMDKETLTKLNKSYGIN